MQHSIFDLRFTIYDLGFTIYDFAVLRLTGFCTFESNQGIFRWCYFCHVLVDKIKRKILRCSDM